MKPLVIGIVGLLIGAVATVFVMQPTPEGAPGPSGDAELVHSLLAENLGDRVFDFATIAESVSGNKVIALDQSPAHLRVTAAIKTAIELTIVELNRSDSPVRKLRRINEASRFFEDGLMARLNAEAHLTCEIPQNRSGNHQRSGYPDLRIRDLETGQVFYLDPKLVEQRSLKSTLRSFYFAPKTKTLKITDDAVHLLIGITHDGNTGQWTFTGWRLVDLSKLQVRLKAEFHASNADLYRETSLPLPPSDH